MNYFNQNSIAKRIAGKLLKKQAQMEEVDGQLDTPPDSLEQEASNAMDADGGFQRCIEQLEESGLIVHGDSNSKIINITQGGSDGFRLKFLDSFENEAPEDNQASEALHDQLYEGTGGFPKIR